MKAKPQLSKVPVTLIRQGKMMHASCAHYDISAMGFAKEDALKELAYRIKVKTGARPMFDVTVRT